MVKIGRKERGSERWGGKKRGEQREEKNGRMEGKRR